MLGYKGLAYRSVSVPVIAPKPEVPSHPPSAVPTPFPNVDEVASESPAPERVASDGRSVVATDDSDARFELARPMHLVLVGWMVNGEVVCGNHTGADLVIPENRVHRGQTFAARVHLNVDFGIRT